MSRANGWAGLLHARAAGCVIGHSARQSEIGVMMMQWRGEAQRALLGYHESKKPDFSDVSRTEPPRGRYALSNITPGRPWPALLRSTPRTIPANCLVQVQF